MRILWLGIDPMGSSNMLNTYVRNAFYNYAQPFIFTAVMFMIVVWAELSSGKLKRKTKMFGPKTKGMFAVMSFLMIAFELANSATLGSDLAVMMAMASLGYYALVIIILVCLIFYYGFRLNKQLSSSSSSAAATAVVKMFTVSP